jgi:hypothetical protein
MRPLRVTGICKRLPNMAAWVGRKRRGTTGVPLVEADIGRWKRVIGHALRSQTNERQAAEVAIAVDVLNRMLELGRPSYVRIE